MGKYDIYKRGNLWVVVQGIKIVYYAPTKEECVTWCKENP